MTSPPKNNGTAVSSSAAPKKHGGAEQVPNGTKGTDNMFGRMVEVRKRATSTYWYQAVIKELKNGDVAYVRMPISMQHWGEGTDGWCTYNVDSFEGRDHLPVKLSDMRDAKYPEQDWQPVIGEDLEVKFEASYYEPGGWALAKLKDVRKGFFFVQLYDEDDASVCNGQEMIVEREVLRRTHPENDFKLLKGDKKNKILKFTHSFIDEKDLLENWFFTDDGRGALAELMKKCGIYTCIVPNEHVRFMNSVQAEMVFFYGGLPMDDMEPVMVSQFKLLLGIHIHHQAKLEDFHKFREQKIDLITTGYLKQRDGFSKILKIEEGLVGSLVGKGGEYLKGLQEKYGVEIDIGKTGLHREVVIFGMDKDKVEECSQACDFCVLTLEAVSDEVFWIRKSVDLDNIVNKTEIQNLRFDNDKQQLEFRGLRPNVELAIMIVEAHLEYFELYQHMDNEMGMITENLNTIKAEVANRKPKGRGKDGTSPEKEPRPVFLNITFGRPKPEPRPKGEKGTDGEKGKKGEKGEGKKKGEKGEGKTENKEGSNGKNKTP